MSCGTYCRECSMATGQCTKCIQGFMVQNGNCVTCTSDVCSCTIANNYYQVYNGQPWVRIALGIALLLIIN